MRLRPAAAGTDRLRRHGNVGERNTGPTKAMVLAAGKGARLFPLTGVLPDSPAVGKAILQHVFELCEGYVCRPPTTGPEELKRQLGIS